MGKIIKVNRESKKEVLRLLINKSKFGKIAWVSVIIFLVIVFSIIIIPRITIEKSLDKLEIPISVYIGDSSMVQKQFVADKVVDFDIEQYGNTTYIAYGVYNEGRPIIYMRKYWLENHSLSKARHVASHNTIDHFQLSQAIDEDGYIHLCWSRKGEYERYIRSQKPEDISRWMHEELFSGPDSTYNELYCYKDMVYNLYRDGYHGQGWKLTWKRRNETTWNTRKVISGGKKHYLHPYITQEGSWLFENPEEQYFAPFWTFDRTPGSEMGERRYQRITRYNLTSGKHYHLNGKVIGYGDGSKLPHEGPYLYYGQCGDIISDNWQLKHKGAVYNEMGKLFLGVQKTNDNIVVMSNIGENPADGFPPRTLRQSVWDGISWSHRILDFSVNEDFGASIIANCKGSNGESIWLVPRKPSNKAQYSSKTDITIIRCRNGGTEVTYENFSDDDDIWYGDPQALYNIQRGLYILGWLQNPGGRDKGNTLYIGFSEVS